MAKQGEIDYLMRIGEAGARHAAGKPYSDVGCGSYLMQIGCIMSLLPQPPCRLLDAGCGTGWTSVLFARRGYDVVGVDISEDMIFHALTEHGMSQPQASRYIPVRRDARARPRSLSPARRAVQPERRHRRAPEQRLFARE